MITINSYQEALGHGVDIANGLIYIGLEEQEILRDLSEEFPDIDFYHVDAVDCYELVSHFGIERIPVTIVMIDGERKHTIEGYPEERELRDAIERVRKG